MKPLKLIAPGTAMIAVTYGLARYSYGLFLPEIRADLEISSFALSLIASCSYAGYLGAIWLSIVLIARIKARSLIIIGGLSASVGMLIVALAQNQWFLAMGIFIAGSGSGWAYPAIPEVVASSIPVSKQGKVLAWINSGTSFGVMLSGPIAIWSAKLWRPAWLIFSVLSLITTYWNANKIPSRKTDLKTQKLPSLQFNSYLKASARPLFIFAFTLGISSSVYWTFAVDLITTTGNIEINNIVQIFWTLVGIFGIVGAFAGNMLPRFGLNFMIRSTMFGLGISLGLLAFKPSSLLIIFLSAVLFGGGFIILTGLIAIWSVEIYNDRPSAGHGASLSLICLGQLLGPIITGILITQIKLSTVFYFAALLAIVISLVVLNSKDSG